MPDDPVPAFARTLRALSVLFQRVASDASSAHGAFGKQDLLALGVLGVRGPSPMGALAEHLGVGPSAVTPVVDRLEAAGVVARRRSEADRRVWLAELTEAGRDVFEADHAAYERVAEAMLSALGPDERPVFVEMLERIGAAVGQGGAGRSRPA